MASRTFLRSMRTRRTIRHFSSEPIDLELVRNAIATAATAPSGANVQPWRFVVVTDPERKRRIREGAEEEERAFYGGVHDEWHEAVAPLGTHPDKPHLTEAPVLIVVFEVHKGGRDPKPYFVKESVGIAVGLLLASLHQAGLATLTHTPSPMRFLNQILERPSNEALRRDPRRASGPRCDRAGHRPQAARRGSGVARPRPDVVGAR